MSNFDIPAMAQSVDPAVRNPFTRMREVVQVLQGLRGDGLDAAVTARNASSLGVITQSVGTGGSTSSGTTIVPDLTPPPTVTNLAAVAGFTQIIVTWDAAVYTQGHGQGQTNIYAVKSIVGAPLPTFSSAQRVYVATGALTIASLPSELNTRWSIWAKWQTADGVESTAPAGGVNGVTVTTGQDITQLLAVLTGQITSSQLYASLGARINLIDGPSTLAGSVAQQIQTEATTRTGADNTLFAQYTVKIDTNGYVSGFGLASSAINATPTSSFIVRADKFSIASPSGPGVAPATPFVVQTTATTVNGVPIPAGVYMDSAYIGNVQAMYGRFGTLIADSLAAGQVNAAHLTLGDGTIGGNLKSTNFSTGSTGWILRPDGTAEFGFANIRGTLTADRINGNNLAIRDSLGNVIIGAGVALAASYAAAGTLNSAVSIGANGALTGAGGGAVTIGGLGYSGALNATYGADWSSNVVGASGVNTSINSAASAATSAQTTANNAASSAAARLSKSGADILTGPISLNAASAILVGTLNDGLYLGSGGLVGMRAGKTTFTLDQAGNARFGGVLTADAINAVTTINLAGKSISDITITNISGSSFSIPFNGVGFGTPRASLGSYVSSGGTVRITVSTSIAIYCTNMAVDNINIALNIYSGPSLALRIPAQGKSVLIGGKPGNTMGLVVPIHASYMDIYSGSQAYTYTIDITCFNSSGYTVSATDPNTTQGFVTVDGNAYLQELKR